MRAFVACTCTIRARKLMLGAERREEVKLFYYEAMPERRDAFPHWFSNIDKSEL